MRSWIAARPQSFTARIALARFLEREGGDAADAIALLDQVVQEGWSDPKYWEVRLRLAADHGKGSTKEVIDRALTYQQDPTFLRIAAFYLMGNAARYKAFADETVRVTKAKYGEAMYMWVAYQARFNTDPEDYAKYTFDWERMRKGFEDSIRLAPKWNPSYHRFARACHWFDDRAQARTLFQRSELEWYEGAEAMWRSRQQYDQIREWALSEGN